MANIIRYNPANSEYDGAVMLDKITHLSKDDSGDLTLIHLSNREILYSVDSINTLEARINTADATPT